MRKKYINKYAAGDIPYVKRQKIKRKKRILYPDRYYIVDMNDPLRPFILSPSYLTREIAESIIPQIDPPGEFMVRLGSLLAQTTLKVEYPISVGYQNFPERWEHIRQKPSTSPL